MDITTEIELQIDADQIVTEASSKIEEIAKEAIEDCDLSDKVDDAVNDIIEEKISEWIKHNPAELLMGMSKAIEWSLNQRQLVIDQAKELEAKRRRILELTQKVEDLANPTNQDLQIQVTEALTEYREICAKAEGLKRGESCLPDRSGQIQRLIWAFDGDEESVKKVQA